ncbi:ribonuclease inhibitor-like [Trichomycterus rosablanca]|uniref:ribonuclease inhibitor-like n=1 Tax=Trichomycterus rosablanca TaxID=2290929 RepID=UPI002F350D3A
MSLCFCRLSDCGVREGGYVALAKALRSNPSSELMELDLRGNDPGDSGVKPLYELLDHPESKLKTLRLLGAAAEEAFTDLKKVVSINLLVERELDLSQKIHGDSGVKKLSELLKDPHCRPTTLRLSDCGVREEGYAALAEALRSNPSSELMELDLRGNHPGDSGVKPLDDLLQNKKSKLNTLRLLGAAAEEAFTDLKKVVSINLLVERELDLSQKIDGDSGVKKLSELLKDPHCRPTTLRLSQCNLTDEGCSALFQVLSSDSSTVRELDLSNNQIQDSGVRLLSDLLNNPNCKLHTVGLSQCNLTDEGCSALFQVLSSDSSTVRELDLSNNHIQDSGVRLISDLLNNPNCKLHTVG